jgi:hypothetical protein
MAGHRRIIRNEAHIYASNRFSPGVGAIHVYPQQNRVLRTLNWMRWWHWTGLAFSLLLFLDARF